MKNLIIDRIIKAWNKAVMIDESIAYTYSKLAFEIINLSTMLDTLKIKNPRICLSASNSFEWIIVFLTALIKGIPIYTSGTTNRCTVVFWWYMAQFFDIPLLA